MAAVERDLAESACPGGRGRLGCAAMPRILNRLREEAPDRFLAALALALGFVVFLTMDQQHWWRLNPEYVFGWLAPIFAVYLVGDRWPKLREIFRAAGPSPLPRWLRGAATAAASLALGGGLAVFLLGAAYRAEVGSTQPGSLALAFGFSGVLLGLVYFNVPDGRVPNAGRGVGTGRRSSGVPQGGTKEDGRVGGGGESHRGGTMFELLRSDARLRAAALFLFPALIWMLSAPLATAVENAVSLFLLRKVVAVVFAVFSLLGLPLVQEGNVLVLPRGQVGVADACSGIRSLTGCLFAGSFLAAVFLDRFWKKALLVAAAMGFAFLTNLLRSLFLTSWAYAYGSDAIEGRLHDGTGYAVLGLTCAGLFCLLPLFSGANWRRWLGLTSR
jgi:exosortase/archaeosortase family protein